MILIFWPQTWQKALLIYLHLHLADEGYHEHKQDGVQTPLVFWRSALMPAATGGKLSSISSQVMWTCLGCWRTRHFSVFWTIWSMRSPKLLPAAKLGNTWFRKLFLQGKFGCGGPTYPCECLRGTIWDFLWDWGFIWGKNQVQVSSVSQWYEKSCELIIGPEGVNKELIM